MARPTSHKVGHKRKRSQAAEAAPKSSRKKLRQDEEVDEEIDSDVAVSEGEESDNDERETAAQKRVRLARMYLETLSKRQGDDEFDAAEIDRDYISQRLQQEVLADAGKVYIRLANKLRRPTDAGYHYTASSSAHRLPVTAAVLSSDCSSLYTASKDGSIFKWDVRACLAESNPSIGRVKAQFRRALKGKEADPRGHAGEVLALALSEDQTILASAGADKVLGVWAVSGDDFEWRKGIKTHRDAISAVAFRKGTSQCYTASFDRTVKIFDLAALNFIDTLFGHQERILDVSVLQAELAVTAGGSDKSVRYFKVADETQLVFRGGGMGSSRLRDVIEGTRAADEVADEDEPRPAQRKRFAEGSIECVAMLDNTHFVSGGNSGQVSLWTTGKKKPIFAVPLAHGLEGGKPRWITAIAALPFSDLFATGSWDGKIHLWALDVPLKTFKRLLSLSVPGVINSLQLLQDPTAASKTYLAAAIGQEPRLGRWFKIKDGKNRAVVVELRAP